MNPTNDNNNSNKILSDFPAERDFSEFSRNKSADIKEDNETAPVSMSQSIISEDMKRSKLAEAKKAHSESIKTTLSEYEASPSRQPSAAPTTLPRKTITPQAVKKPPTILVIGSLAGIFVIGILGGMLLFKDREADEDMLPSKSTAIAATTEVPTTTEVSISIEKVTEVVTELATVNEITTSPTETSVATQDQNSNIPDEYKDYPYIENAVSNMAFYTGENIPVGKVCTEDTGLNLRKAPNIYVDVIKELPKGEVVWILGESAEWYYVGYNLRKPSGYDYVGYVSKQFVSLF